MQVYISACKMLNPVERYDTNLVFHGLVLIITLMNKLLNLPIVTAGQSSHFTLTPAYLLPMHRSATAFLYVCV